MNLNTPFDTHFQACIREACRYTIIQGLIKRNTQGSEPQRKDMVGIEPHIDLGATMALLNSKSDKTEEEIINASSAGRKDFHLKKDVICRR